MDLRDRIALLILLMPIGIVVFLASFYILAIIGLHAGLLKLHLLEFHPIPKAENLGWITVSVGSTIASLLAVRSCFNVLEKRIR
jgi:hypothetical protein